VQEVPSHLGHKVSFQGYAGKQDVDQISDLAGLSTQKVYPFALNKKEEPDAALLVPTGREWDD